MNTEQHIKQIISERFAVPFIKITPQKHIIDDFLADSLDQVELIMALEDEFSIEIPEEDAEKLKTVNDIIKYIEEKV
ncbi:acyl carrier protein [candidate division KSB1 bacterium]|nr:MAG: acyl carrier protein [candidate division KSB1 bacterium]